jgi:serine/threonine protein kinase
VKIADFGLARYLGGGLLINADSKHDAEGSDRVVSLWYRPPEILAQQKHHGAGGSSYSSALDVWGLGCMVAEMVGGEVVFRARDEADAVKTIGRKLGKLLTFEGSREEKEARKRLVEAGFCDVDKLREMREDYLVFKGHVDSSKNVSYKSLLFSSDASEVVGEMYADKSAKGFSVGSKLWQLSDAGVGLLKSCLRYNPARRATARVLLGSTWWGEVPRAYGSTEMPTFQADGAFRQTIGGGKEDEEALTYEV